MSITKQAEADVGQTLPVRPAPVICSRTGQNVRLSQMSSLERTTCGGGNLVQHARLPGIERSGFGAAATGGGADSRTPGRPRNGRNSEGVSRAEQLRKGLEIVET